MNGRLIDMTNGDRIRNMTDTQLADFLMSYDSKVCSHCKYDDDIGCNFHEDGGVICTEDYVHSVFMNWLSSEVVSERSENSSSIK